MTTVTVEEGVVQVIEACKVGPQGEKGDKGDPGDVGPIVLPEENFLIGNAVSEAEAVPINDYFTIQNGFENISDSQISFDEVTKTFTISPTGPSYRIWSNNKLYIRNAPDNIVIADVEELQFIYFDDDSLLQSTTAFVDDIITRWAFVAVIDWSVIQQKAILVGDERHGHEMSSATHLYNHHTIGARYGVGFQPINVLADENGSLDSHAYFGITGGEFWDEDIRHIFADGNPQDLEPIGQFPVLYRSGPEGRVVFKDPIDNFPIATAGTGRLAWNEFTGTTYQLTEVDNQDFVLCHLMATNDYRRPVMTIVGQAEYNSLTAAREGTNTEINALVTGEIGILFPEFLIIATFIYQTSNNYGNTVKARIRSTSDGDPFVDWRGATITQGAGVGITTHNQLAGLEVDDHLQYHNDIRGDARYYLQSQVDSAVAEKVHWRGNWIYADYLKNDMVLDGSWTMIANKDTDERAAPIPIGEIRSLYDGTLSTTSLTANQIIIGIRITAEVDGFIDGYRAYVYPGNVYSGYVVLDPLGSSYIYPVGSFVALAEGWRVFKTAPVLALAGETIDVFATIIRPDPVPTTTVTTYNYVTTNSDSQTPLSGQIVHARKSTSPLRVHYTDDTATDRTALLQALITGDIIEGAGIAWVVQGPGTDQTTFIDFKVSPAVQGAPDGSQQFDIIQTTDSSVPYGLDSGYWTPEPNISGLYALDAGYESIIPDQNAYGIDLLIQDAIIPTDWDVVASSGGVLSGDNASVPWGNIYGNLPDQQDLQAALDAKLGNVVEDTTPQVGGPFDINGNKIISVSDGNIDIEPDGTGNVLLGNFTFDADQVVGAGQDDYVLTYNHSNGLISLEEATGGGGSGRVNAGTLATTSGTSHFWDSLPNTATIITLLFDRVSVSSTTNTGIQVGDSSGFILTGYTANKGRLLDNAQCDVDTSLDAFGIKTVSASDKLYGVATLRRSDVSSNSWICEYNLYSSANSQLVGGGAITLPTPLDRVRILRIAGGNFDAGEITLYYE